MRSGSSLSRYAASSSCACLSGPPVRRTADRGSGRAAAGTALVIGPAAAALAANAQQARRHGRIVCKFDIMAEILELLQCFVYLTRWKLVPERLQVGLFQERR